MSNFGHDDLPPDLADLGRRMRDERPRANDDELDRMMQRARTSARPTQPRARRRTLAASLTAMVAMLSVTSVAAAALFGISFGSIGNALTNSNKKIGQASSQALKAPSTTRAPAVTNTRPAASLGSSLGLGSILGRRPATGASTPAVASGPSASLIPGLPNAGNHQYGGRGLVCRILRALGLRFIARLLGC